MKGRAIAYTQAELDWVRDNCTLPRKDLHARFVATFGRGDVTLQNLASLCKRNGWLTGRDGRFQDGKPSWNKGAKGLRFPGSEKGWFRKGSRNGVAAEKYQPIGTERLSKDGYLERKIHDGMPLQSRWRAVHLVEWEKLNGPVPEGHALKCLDGDRTNTDPANWTLVPRALLPRLAGKSGRDYDNAPADLKPLIMATARLEQAARDAKGPKT